MGAYDSMAATGIGSDRASRGIKGLVGRVEDWVGRVGGLVGRVGDLVGRAEDRVGRVMDRVGDRESGIVHS